MAGPQEAGDPWLDPWHLHVWESDWISSGAASGKISAMSGNASLLLSVRASGSEFKFLDCKKKLANLDPSPQSRGRSIQTARFPGEFPVNG